MIAPSKRLPDSKTIALGLRFINGCCGNADGSEGAAARLAAPPCPALLANSQGKRKRAAMKPSPALRYDANKARPSLPRRPPKRKRRGAWPRLSFRIRIPNAAPGTGLTNGLQRPLALHDGLDLRYQGLPVRILPYPVLRPRVRRRDAPPSQRRPAQRTRPPQGALVKGARRSSASMLPDAHAARSASSPSLSERTSRMRRAKLGASSSTLAP